YTVTLDVYSPSWDDFTDYENLASLVFTKTISLDITADMTAFALTFDLEKVENAMGLLNIYYYLGTSTYENLTVFYKVFKSSDYMSGNRNDTHAVIEFSLSEQNDKENDYLTTNFPLPALDESYIITGNVLYEEDGTLLPLRKTEIVKVLPGKFVDVNFYDPSYGQSSEEKIYSVKLNVVGPDGNPLVTKDTTDSDWNTNICRTQLEGCDFAYSEATVEIKSDKESFMELPILVNQTLEGETYYFYGWYFDKEGKIPAFNTSFIAGQCGGDTDRFSEDSTYLELFGVDLHGNVPMLYPKWKKSYKLYSVGEINWDESTKKDVVYVNDEGTNVKNITLDGKYVWKVEAPETMNYKFAGFYYDEAFTIPLNSVTELNSRKGCDVTYYLVNEDFDFEGDVYIYAKYLDIFGMFEKPIDADTGELATALSELVYFGVFPKSVVPESRFTDSTPLVIDETDKKIVGAYTYYKGNDDNWYVKADENSYGTSSTYSDGSIVQKADTTSTRYFRAEPIRWKVLTLDYNGSKKALLVAENVLTGNIPFYQASTSRTIDGSTIYANNYKYSTIRAYLNGKYETDDTQSHEYEDNGFLQTAFTREAQNYIENTLVDNSADSARYDATVLKTHSCENTNDKIFLLSTSEVFNTTYGFDEYDSSSLPEKHQSRHRVSTDFAKANNVIENSNRGTWWLRSPYGSASTASETAARTITYQGANGNGSANLINYGVVPALTISLQ
ncbi:MAG: DUF6273 domain-containing protein, partial [Treponema sp.]|nr:DUF6273 domain-containing protein [Treponema sp.]